MKAIARQIVLATLCVFAHSTSAVLGNNERLIPINEHPDYRLRVEPSLKKYTREYGKRGYNHYFVEAVDARKYTGNQKCPWIFWQEGNQLILFEPKVAGSPFDDLVYSRRKLSMTRDVLSKSFHGDNTSTYMLTYEEALSIKKSCLRGNQFVIRK